MSFLNKSLPQADQYNSALGVAAKVLLMGGTFILPLFFLPYTTDIFQLPKQLLLFSLVLVALLLWLVSGVLTKELHVRRTFLDMPIFVFLAAVIISAIFSVLPRESFLGDAANFVLHVSVIIAGALWFWLFVQYVRTRELWEWMIALLLGSGVLVGGLFLVRAVPLFSFISTAIRFNTISTANSILGVHMALLGILAFGLLIIRSRRLSAQIVPAIAGIMSVAVLLQLGYPLSWIIFAVGIGLLLIIGSSMLGEIRLPMLSLVFFLFLISVIFIFTGTPAWFQGSVPVEIALDARNSWAIASSSVLSGVKAFFLGSGPGTFVYDFSLFRPAALNADTLAWSIRFYQPYSTILAFLAELGALGTLAFLFIILFGLGSMFGAWLKTRPSVWSRAAAHDATAVRLEVFVIIAVWIAATLGLCLSFYDLTGWWLWWWLLGASIVGLSTIVPDFIKERTLFLNVSPQYALALSFSLVLLCTGIMIAGVFGGRYYLAEVAYTRAVASANPDMVEQYVTEAVSYRPSYVPYHVALAQVALQKASVESQKPSPNSSLMAQKLSTAVNEARFAADAEPNNIATWDTLATMYMNARSFTPDATDWAIDALNHALALSPTDAVLQWRLAGVYEAAGKFQDAEKAYKQAISLKPDYGAAYLSLSALYENQNQLDNAILVYQPIMRAVEQNADMLYNLGRLFFNRRNSGDDTRAKQVWEQALAVEPNHSNVLYSLGLLAERQGDRQTAIKYYQRVRELNPNNQDVKKKLNSLSVL